MTHFDEACRLLRKADQDQAIVHAIKNHPGIGDEAVCFHAQQAVEKCFKAVLLARGVTFRRTHDLDELVDHILDAGISFPFPADHFSLLTPFAVHWRYEDLDIAISGRLSLRRPQRRALEILDHITELLPLRKDNDLQAALAVILEREAQQWFKPARGQFQIHYNGAWSTTSTSPISWRKREAFIDKLEPKTANQMEEDEVEGAGCGDLVSAGEQTRRRHRR
ncbi:MAG: HEPN domain-containing protein [Magnetococcales bacterium]|nr:HEPN domain-containing protein [Magnetococcales bacterium]